MKKKTNKEFPEKDQLIVFKTKESLVPEVGQFQSFENGIHEIYVFWADDVESIDNIEWWCEIPE